MPRIRDQTYVTWLLYHRNGEKTMINEDLNRTVKSEIVTEKQKEDRKKKESKRQLDNYYYLKSLGVCTRCGREDVFPGHVCCPSCMEKQQKKSRDYYHRLSDEDRELRRKKRMNTTKNAISSEKQKGCVLRVGKKHSREFSV